MPHDELLERWVILEYRDRRLHAQTEEFLTEQVALAEPIYQAARAARRYVFADMVDDFIRERRLMLSGLSAVGRSDDDEPAPN